MFYSFFSFIINFLNFFSLIYNFPLPSLFFSILLPFIFIPKFSPYQIEFLLTTLSFFFLSFHFSFFFLISFFQISLPCRPIFHSLASNPRNFFISRTILSSFLPLSLSFSLHPPPLSPPFFLVFARTRSIFPSHFITLSRAC